MNWDTMSYGFKRNNSKKLANAHSTSNLSLEEWVHQSELKPKEWHVLSFFLIREILNIRCNLKLE